MSTWEKQLVEKNGIIDFLLHKIVTSSSNNTSITGEVSIDDIQCDSNTTNPINTTNINATNDSNKQQRVTIF